MMQFVYWIRGNYIELLASQLCCSREELKINQDLFLLFSFHVFLQEDYIIPFPSHLARASLFWLPQAVASSILFWRIHNQTP